MTERWTVDWVGDALGNTLDSATERVVLSLVVVVAHITLVLGRVDGRSRGGTLYSNLLWLRSGELSCVATEAGAGVFVVVTGGGTSDGDGVLAVLTLGSVEVLLERWSLTTDDTTFTIVDAFLGVGVVLYVELSVGVAGVWFRVASISFSGDFDATGLHAFWLRLTFTVVNVDFFLASVGALRTLFVLIGCCVGGDD